MKKLSQTLLIVLLFAASATSAQGGSESFEYATVVSTVTYSSPTAAKPMLFVSFSNGEFKAIEIDKGENKASFYINQTSALKYIAELNKEGWEVVNSQINNIGVPGSLQAQSNWCYFLKENRNNPHTKI